MQGITQPSLPILVNVYKFDSALFVATCHLISEDVVLVHEHDVRRLSPRWRACRILNPLFVSGRPATHNSLTHSHSFALRLKSPGGSLVGQMDGRMDGWMDV